MIYKVASRFAGSAKERNLDIEDLCQVGILGYIRAWDTFDPERGVKFSTHAFNCVKSHIQRFLRDFNMIRLPGERRYESAPVVSLETVVFDDGRSPVLLEDLLGKEEDQTGVYVHEFINELSEKEKSVVLGMLNGFTQKEIAESLGVSRTMVGRYLTSARKKYESYQGVGGRAG